MLERVWNIHNDSQASNGYFTPRSYSCAVCWYLWYSLSYRHIQGWLVERGLHTDPQLSGGGKRYAPELEERTRPHLKTTNKSWRVEGTYVRIKGQWFVALLAS